MHRLVVNPGSPQAWEIELQAGSNTIGRGPDNDFTIAHSSVSTRHCQILLEPGALSIQDLGSTNGTFVNELPVTQAPLRPGESIRLGSVTLLLESGAGTLPPPAGPPAPAAAEPRAMSMAQAPSGGRPALDTTVTPAKPIPCKNHYQNLGRYHCPTCARYLCDLCVNTRGASAGGLKFCKICGGECAPVSFAAGALRINFFDSLPQAFKYPFQGDGLMLLFGGAFFFGFLDLANYVARHGFQYALRAMMMRVVIFTFIFGVGYLFSYLKKIIAATADADPRMPDWPEFSEWKEDIVVPVFQFVVLALASFGPAVAVQVWSEGDYPWLVWPLALLGCVYFPMAFLGVAMFDTLAAVSPRFVVGSIARVPREYAVAALIFAAILGLRWLSETALEKLLHIPLAPALVADLMLIALLMIEARVLGLLFLSRKASLDWFARRSPRPSVRRK